MIFSISKMLDGPFNEWTVENALRRIVAAVSGGWGVQHKPDGTHGAVTATSVNVSGALSTSGEQVLAMTGTANHNVVLQDTTTMLLASLSGAVTITGFSGGTSGRRFVLVNAVISVDALTLALDSASSVSANRIQGDASVGGDTIVIQPGRAVELIYRATSVQTPPRWHAMVKA